MKLYEGWRSSASWRVRWTLALKKVPYESVLLDIESGEHERVLEPIHPMRQLPTLELDDGQTLAESVAIIEWLEENHPEPALLPVDPMARAHVRELVQFVNSGIHPLQNTKVRKAISTDSEAQRRWCCTWIERGIAAYEARIETCGGRFSLGDHFTMADLYLVPQVRNAQRHGADISGCARVLRVYASCMEMPEARATDPHEVRKRVRTSSTR
jgi:maleylacetoacetate isomerase